MARFRLRTLGPVLLVGPDGPVPLDEPRLIALLVMLAIAGDAGVSDDELLLRILPSEKPEHARTELARVMAVARLRLGGEQAIVRKATGHALAPGVLSIDVRVLDAPSATECAELLAGFKLPGSPEFREWLAETRRRVEPLPELAPAPFARRRLAITLAAALLLLAAALWFAMPRRVSGFATGNPVLLADVRNESGDTIFDVGIQSAATVALQQSAHLRLWPRSRLAEVYRLMEITNRDTALTFELAQDVAQRDHVRFVLGLDVARAASGYRITARLADVERQALVAEERADAASREEVIAALGKVLLAIRQRLGETREDLRERRIPLPQVTTTSLEALRSYGEGSVAWARGNYRLAGELWTRATDIDTGFAMAYGALGSLYYYSHDRARGEQYYAEALKRAHRLTEREQLRLLEGLADYRGNVDSSLVLSQRLAVRYPSVVTWYNHGTGLLGADRPAEAIQALQTGLAYDSSHLGSQINMATALNRLGRRAEALRYYARAARIDSLALYRNNINHEWGSTFVELGRAAEAESVFRRMSTASAKVENRAIGLRSLGYLHLWRGDVEQAIALFAQAAGAARQSGAPLSEARNRMLLAGAYEVAGRPADAGREIDLVLAMIGDSAFEPRFLALVIGSCVRLDRLADADSSLRLLRRRMDAERPVDRAAEALSAGLISLARQYPDSALSYARAARRYPQDGIVRMLEIGAWRALGQRDSARVGLDRLLADPLFGEEGQEEWLRAPLVLGDVLVAHGDSAGARKAYQRLIDQWRAAPRDLPDLATARARLASLRRRGE